MDDSRLEGCCMQGGLREIGQKRIPGPRWIVGLPKSADFGVHKSSQVERYRKLPREVGQLRRGTGLTARESLYALGKERP